MAQKSPELGGAWLTSGLPRLQKNQNAPEGGFLFFPAAYGENSMRPLPQLTEDFDLHDGQGAKDQTDLHSPY
jgi:hypothetical protein